MVGQTDPQPSIAYLYRRRTTSGREYQVKMKVKVILGQELPLVNMFESMSSYICQFLLSDRLYTLSADFRLC